MNTTKLANEYLDSIEAANLDKIANLLSENAIVEIPFSLTGAPVPMHRFVGKAECLNYFKLIIDNFHYIGLVDRSTFTTVDKKTAFVELKGHLVQRGTNAPYDNIYLVKLTAENDKIVAVTEYTNPIAYGKLMGLQLG